LNSIDFNTISEAEKTLAISRLTALWAFVEAGLGGMLHAFKLPFTGLIVGGMAILMITLLVHFTENKASKFFKCLLVVLIIKAIVSPHSPLPAYFAVTFQAVFGYLFYRIFQINSLSILSVSVVAMLESAVQKLIILTVFFGVSFWNSINKLIGFIFSQFGMVAHNGEMWIVYLYLGIYFSGGIIIGISIKGIMKDIFSLRKMPEMVYLNEPVITKVALKKKFNGIFIITTFLILISIYFLLFIPDSKLAWVNISKSIVYTITVLIIWYIFLNPILMKLLHKFFKQKENKYQQEVNEAMILLPALKGISAAAWKFSATKKGLQRLRYFTSLLVYWTLTDSFSKTTAA